MIRVNTIDDDPREGWSCTRNVYAMGDELLIVCQTTIGEHKHTSVNACVEDAGASVGYEFTSQMLLIEPPITDARALELALELRG